MADILWAPARDSAEFTLAAAEEPSARIRPYPDDEDGEDEETAHAQHDPVHRKVHVLQGCPPDAPTPGTAGFPWGPDRRRPGSRHRRRDRPVRTRTASPGIAPPDPSEPFVDAAKDILRTGLDPLHTVPDRAGAVAAVRARSEHQAALLAGALLPHRVRERGWSAADLRAAHGVRRVRAT
ncbi:hypothetical protein FOF52_21490 [Thermobifida alba]|uniref:Uncharacterized protein n=1 Tax=Thermobifida alba TaxID=53522 RepID=A0ABY4L6E3_THEAE|nr:hypothetical protein [Thermobifida alba]UPT23197.1 hypothetical protein FOF52_21490 [Thermobifida alba]